MTNTTNDRHGRLGETKPENLNFLVEKLDSFLFKLEQIYNNLKGKVDIIFSNRNGNINSPQYADKDGKTGWE